MAVAEGETDRETVDDEVGLAEMVADDAGDDDGVAVGDVVESAVALALAADEAAGVKLAAAVEVMLLEALDVGLCEAELVPDAVALVLPVLLGVAEGI